MPDFRNPHDALRHYVSGAVERGEKQSIVAMDAGKVPVHDSVHLAHVADAIDRMDGDVAGFGYDETADMAAHMLDRFPAVRTAAAGYAAGDPRYNQGELDSAVLDALAEF